MWRRFIDAGDSSVDAPTLMALVLLVTHVALTIADYAEHHTYNGMSFGTGAAAIITALGFRLMTKGEDHGSINRDGK